MDKYAVYRCLQPNAKTTNSPWFREEDSCPCNPILSNPTGRGLMGCPFGVQFEKSWNETIPLTKSEQIVTNSGIENINKNVNTKISLPGSMFQNGQFIPPQLEPRPLSRIGVEYRF